MAAVWICFRAELRSRWRAWVALTLLVGIAGGVVLAAAAGARRTDSSVGRYHVATRASHVAVGKGVTFPNGRSRGFRRWQRPPASRTWASGVARAKGDPWAPPTS